MKLEVLSLVSPFCSLSMPLRGFIAHSTALPTAEKIYKRVHSLIDIYCNPFLLSLFEDTLLPYFVCLFKEFMSCLVMIVCLAVLVTSSNFIYSEHPSRYVKEVCGHVVC